MKRRVVHINLTISEEAHYRLAGIALQFGISRRRVYRDALELAASMPEVKRLLAERYRRELEGD